MGKIEQGLARFYSDAVRSNRVFRPVSSIPHPMTYPWPATPEALGEVEETIKAVLADPVAHAKVQELAGQMEQTTGEGEPALQAEDLLRRIEDLEQAISQLQANEGESLTDSDSRRRARIAVFCIVQGILLVLASILGSNSFTWLCNLVAMAFQFGKPSEGVTTSQEDA